MALFIYSKLINICCNNYYYFLYVHYFNETVRYSFDTILTTYYSMLKRILNNHKNKIK